MELPQFPLSTIPSDSSYQSAAIRNEPRALRELLVKLR